MKGKNYKIVSLYSFFPFQENLILDLKNKLLEIENENDLSGLLIFASEGINGTICAEKNVTAGMLTEEQASRLADAGLTRV